MTTSTKAVMVFLVGFFVISASFVIIWGVNIYKDTTSFSNKTSSEEINCVGYVYEISGMQYYDSTLFLEVNNEQYSNKKIDTITVIVGNQSVQAAANIDQGMSQTVSFQDIFIDDEFFIYPDDCKDFTVKCSLFTQDCGIVKPFP